MNSEKLAGILGAIVAVVALVAAIVYGPIGQMGKPAPQAQKAEPAAPVAAAPPVRGPVVRDVPQHRLNRASFCASHSTPLAHCGDRPYVASNGDVDA